jgi:hypothetical protein
VEERLRDIEHQLRAVRTPDRGAVLVEALAGLQGIV